MSLELIQRFKDLFSPHPDFQGVYGSGLTEDPDKPGKMVSTSRPYTKRKKWDITDWVRHFEGKERFGGIPIRPDNTLRFAAIDVDKYNVNDHEKTAIDLGRINLNLILCRSKSGGKHMYMFFREDVQASIVRRKLQEISGFLGISGSEIFPKQSSLTPGSTETGNWINLPYFNAMNGTEQFAYCPSTGKPMSVEEFVTYVEEHRFNASDLKSLKLLHKDSLFHDGPPCLQTLFQTGVVEDMRNTTMLNAGIYAARANINSWYVKMDEYNQMFEPPLAENEMREIKKRVQLGKYSYQCSTVPLCLHCNKSLCLKREYGKKSDSYNIPIIESLTKYDALPPVWWVYLEGGTKVSCSTEELQNPKLFQKRAMEQANIVLPVAKQKDWEALLSDLMKKVSIVEVPKESTSRGILLNHIYKYLGTYCTFEDSKSLNDLLQSPVIRYQGVYYFGIIELIKYVNNHHYQKVTPTELSIVLREIGADYDKVRFTDTSRSVYKLPKEIVNVSTQPIPEIPDSEFHVF